MRAATRAATRGAVRAVVRVVSVSLAVAAGALLAAGCSSGDGTQPHTKSSSASEAKDPSHDGLADAIGKAIRADKGYSIRDATDLNRDAGHSEPRYWKVCFQEKNAELDAVDFAVVLKGESCPAEEGGHVRVPKAPRLVGADFSDAYQKVLRMGYPAYRIQVFYGSGGVLDDADLDRVRGEVCTQSPRAGAAFGDPDHVKLYVAEGRCPS
ncbi:MULTISPECIES: hypothetical protein [unclassified Streptomyces]|uniref:hypothetical protein n=1 Tax=unclassified Streptomyces TaxID=2593676 RepID=UPI00278BF7AA|nr:MULTISPECIES: hypothetical protein [unclassified Streptomyces]